MILSKEKIIENLPKITWNDKGVELVAVKLIDVSAAMNEHAKQVAIAFVKWKKQNVEIFDNPPTEQLFDTFIKQFQ